MGWVIVLAAVGISVAYVRPVVVQVPEEVIRVIFGLQLLHPAMHIDAGQLQLFMLWGQLVGEKK